MPTATKPLNPNAPETVAFVPPAGEVNIEIPPQAFKEPVDVTVKVPAAYPSAASPAAQMKGLGVGVEIVLNKALQPAKGVSITIGYENASLPAGTDEARLILARHDVDKNVWVPLVSSVDAKNKKVKAQTNHFSVFQVMEMKPASSVSSAKVFPNPFMPSKGHSSVTFSDLPANAVIKIYTLAGELVRELTANATGMAPWDAKNDSGEDLANGVYFCLAQGEGGKKVFKVAVQR